MSLCIYICKKTRFIISTGSDCIYWIVGASWVLANSDTIMLLANRTAHQKIIYASLRVGVNARYIYGLKLYIR
jgi:hypothetical protein